MTEKQTTLDLNGPILSFITQPVGLSTSLSTATFVGIATATFPTQTPANPATNTGTIGYRWYAEGSALTDGSFRGATISGTATTTLTLSNLKSPETNNVNFFLRADYTPSAYGLPGVAITEGTARFTGNAVNDPLDSNTATLTVLPVITITSQPVDATVGVGGRVSFSVSAAISDGGFGGLSYQWNVDGQNLIDNGDTIIGATQSTLFFTPQTIGTPAIKVTVSNPNAVSVVSNIANLSVIPGRNIIIVEGFDSQNNYNRKEINLDQLSDFTLTDATLGANFNTITFHASEKNINADLEIRTSKGSDLSPYSGGEGGYSRIKITLEKNIEYAVLGIHNNSGIFIYRRSTLIAAVGKGGDAGTAGNGGSGGGINISGENGSGRGAGVGGARLSAGQLTLNGIFGSSSTITTFLPGDSKATIPNGGRTISCPKGSYWVATRGIPPCSNIGLTQFYNTNGTLISQSSLINRGFKPGYSITDTVGSKISSGGNGGNGVTGGSGGNVGGGGGGSGYTDDSYTIISSSSGGNSLFKSTINFKLYVEPPRRGCTDPRATNYDPSAVIDDGSCIRPGCTDPRATNYNPLATVDNGSCILPRGCTDPNATNYNPSAVINEGCIYPLSGCTDPNAINYNPLAVINDGSCIYSPPPRRGCTDPNAINYDPLAVINEGCIFPPPPRRGCTDPRATNYDPSAVIDNGSCILPRGCTDRRAANYNPSAVVDDGSCILPRGCTDPRATNYNPSAVINDGSCTFPDTRVRGCTDRRAANYNPSAVVDDGSCILLRGCTISGSCNYNPNAVINDGSCIPRVPLTGSSSVGTGFRGYLQYNNGIIFGEGVTFITSLKPEFASNPRYQNAQAYVLQYYLGVIGRYPEDAGYDFWVTQAVNLNQTQQQVNDAIAAAYFSPGGERDQHVANGRLRGNYRDDSCGTRPGTRMV